MEDRGGVAGDRDAGGALPALRFPGQFFSALLTAGAQAVLDFLIEDACVLCGAPPRSCCTDDGPPPRYSGPFLDPVVGLRLFVGSLHNHPVCPRCAGGFETALGAGVLGRCDDGGVVTKTTGERFHARPTEVAGHTVPGRVIPVVSPFMTNDNVLKIIHLIKFGDYRGLVRPVAKSIVEAYRSRVVDEVTVLVPTPMEVGEFRRRRFNLPGLIAGHLQSEFDIPLIENTLKKLSKTVPQSRTSRHKRAANVRGVFGCINRELAGKRVLLVDDLVTTGATAAACASTILASGAASLEVICFARAL